MRILHIDGARTWGGGQNQIRLLMHGLARHDVPQLCLCPETGPLAERLRAEGLPVRGLRWDRAFDVRTLPAIVREAARHDLIHAHDSHALQAGLLAGIPLGVPVVASRRVRFRTRPLTWNRTAAIVCVSETVHAHVLRSGVDADRVVTVHSGVDLDELQALRPAQPSLRARIGVPETRFLAGTVGTLLEYKHQERIVDAAALAPADLAWVLIGDGPRREALQERIAELGVGDRVHMTGQLPDARRHLREMDTFVLPSIGEALGTSVLDAMALGVPVVASDSAGPAEVLAPVHQATMNTLVAPEDPAAFAAAVARYRDDPVLREAAITRQRTRVQDFSIDRTVEKTLGVYARVLNG